MAGPEQSSLLERDAESGPSPGAAPPAWRRRWALAAVAVLCFAALLALAGAVTAPAGAGTRLSSPHQGMLQAYPSSVTGSVVDQSPTRKWQTQHAGDPKVAAGFKKVQDIKTGHVIDDFMSANPEIRRILWDEHYDGPATVAAAEAYAKKLVIYGTEAEYMKSKGCVFQKKSKSGKRNKYICNGEKRSAKPTKDFAEKNGPNSGFMRVFFHDVAIKLRQFNADYGWDEGLDAAIYTQETNTLTLVHKHYDKDWTGDPSKSPKPWILPQMHYLGVFANDIGSEGQNFAVKDGDAVATPVDLDAVWRGEYYSFLKVLTPAQTSKVLDLNYIQVA